MAWIFMSSTMFHQQQSALRTTRIDGLKTGLKNPGCKQVLGAFGRTSKKENQTFSTGWRFLWNLLDNDRGLS
jgi:hypothetical protein